VWVWGLGLTETCISGFLLFGPWVCYECNSGGTLELWQRNRAPFTLYRIMGHNGPVLRLRCIRTGKARTQILFCSILSSILSTNLIISCAIYAYNMYFNITHQYYSYFPVSFPSNNFRLFLVAPVCVGSSLYVTQPISTEENKQWSPPLCSFPVTLSNH